MDHHIGFAFSVEQIAYAVFESPDMVLSAVGTASYPFDYAEDRFLQQESRISLGSVLKKILDNEHLHPRSLAFTIESNLAALKRIIYPENLEESGIADHITWHLAESLNLPVKEYAIVRSDNITVRGGLKEELVISIQKKLVGFFRELARDLELPLKLLTVHHLAAELALNSALSDQPDKRIILFKAAPGRCESTFFLDGRYYKSHYDPVSGTDYQAELIKKVKLDAGFIESALQSSDQDDTPADRILIYGPQVDEGMLSLLQKNMSIPVDRFNPLQNIVISDDLKSTITDEIASRYVECVGVALDQ